MNDITKKCNSFFTWLGDPKTALLAEHLWKHSMIKEATYRFPQLSYLEISRLVDRDWKYMPAQEREVRVDCGRGLRVP